MTAARSPEPFLAQLRLEVLNAVRNTDPSPSQPNFNKHLALSIVEVHYLCSSATDISKSSLGTAEADIRLHKANLAKFKLI